MGRKRKLLLQKIASLFISIVVLVALLAVVAAFQDRVIFKDEGLEAAVRDKLGLKKGIIIRSDLLQITKLDATGYKINKLNGIENLSRLEVLILEDNEIEDVSPLKELTRLTELSLRNNKITCLDDINFEEISNLPLRFLSLRHNVLRPEEGGQIRLSDLSLLSQFNTLEELDLRDNHIEDLSPIENLVSLKILDLRENNLMDLTPLQNLTGLRELNIRYNEVKDLTPLSSLNNLTYLNIHSNHEISTVEPLEGLINLETLIMPYIDVDGYIDPLVNMHSLRRLNIRNIGLNDSAVLVHLMGHGALQDRVDDGVMADVDLRGNPVLREDNSMLEPLRQYWVNIERRLPYTLPIPEFDEVEYVKKQGDIINLYLYINEADLIELYSRDRHSNERLPALARFGKDNPVKYYTDLRFRGNTLRALEKKSFNIRFESDHEFIFGGNYLNLNSMYSDPSMMREHLAFEMFHELGLPAPRTDYVNLWINDIYEGLYLQVERIDENFLDAMGLNPEGMLLRDQFRSARSDYDFDRASAMGFELSQIPDGQRDYFLSNTFNYREDTNWESLADLLLWLETAEPGPEFMQEFEERFKVEQFIDFWAIHYIIHDYDSFNDDYWLYLDYKDPEAKWVIIPWDKDLSFGSRWRPGHGVANDFFNFHLSLTDFWGNNDLVSLILHTSDLRYKLEKRIIYLKNEVFTPEFIEKKIEETWEMIEPSIDYTLSEDQRFELHGQEHHSRQGDEYLHKELLLDFIELRYAFLDRLINPVEGVPYQARKSLSNLELDDVVMLTDPHGWTIAKLELKIIPTEPGNIEVTVTENPAIDGIDRIWEFNNSGSAVEAELTLYYRNQSDDPSEDHNWVTGTTGFSEGQHDLKMARYDDGKPVIIEGSRVNPYSNKVVAEIIIEPGESGNRYFIIND